MKTFVLAALSLLTFGNTALADSGPFVCACQIDTRTSNSSLVVTDLASGKEIRLGSFAGSSAWRTVVEGQATNACVEALKAQAICRLGRAE